MQRYSRDTTDSRKCGQNLCISRTDTAFKDGVSQSSRACTLDRVLTYEDDRRAALRENNARIEAFIAEVNILLATERNVPRILGSQC